MTIDTLLKKLRFIRNQALAQAHSSQKRIYNGMINRYLDYKLGIETRTVLEKKDFGLPSGKLLSSNRYEGTAYSSLKTIFSPQHYPIKGKSILDVGSGKGRVLFYSLSHGATRATGIEHSPKLNEFFHINEKRFTSKVRQQQGTAQIFEGSFQDYPAPLDFDYIFLSNPFNEELFAIFLDWLVERIQKKTRIIYYSPQHSSLILNKGGMLEKEIRTPLTGETTLVYRF